MQHPRLPHLALRRPHARRPLPRRPRPLQSPRRAAAGPRRRRAGVLAARPRPPPRHRLAALPPRRRRRGRDGAGEAGLGEVAQDLRRVGPHRAGGAARARLCTLCVMKDTELEKVIPARARLCALHGPVSCCGPVVSYLYFILPWIRFVCRVLIPSTLLRICTRHARQRDVLDVTWRAGCGRLTTDRPGRSSGPTRRVHLPIIRGARRPTRWRRSATRSPRGRTLAAVLRRPHGPPYALTGP